MVCTTNVSDPVCDGICEAFIQMPSAFAVFSMPEAVTASDSSKFPPRRISDTPSSAEATDTVKMADNIYDEIEIEVSIITNRFGRYKTD